MRIRPLILCLVLVAPLPLAAQGRPVGVRGVRNLNFGMVLPGVPQTVLRTDAANSGQYDIAGDRDAVVQLTFTLPSAMTGPGGAALPLSFAAGDAGYSQSQAIGSQVGFDPRAAFVATLSKTGRASVFLGGTALPSTAQRAGTYTATVTLTVAYVP